MTQKKWSAVYLFLVAVLAIAALNVGVLSSFAYNAEFELTVPTTMYNEPDRWTFVPGQTLDPQLVYVVDKGNDGWYKIETWMGPKWINIYPDELDLQEDYPLYNEPDKANPLSSGVTIGAQKVSIIQRGMPNWVQISTWMGPKWIHLERDYVNLMTNTYLYDDTDRETFVSGYTLSPQTVAVLERRPGGWMRVNSTWGEKWINLYPDTIVLNEKTFLYDLPDREYFTTGHALDPQTVTILERRDGGWKLIETYWGIKWINLTADTIELTYPIRFYNSPDYKDFEDGATLEPQTITVIERWINGWIKVQTWKGARWINFEPETVDIKTRTQLFRSADRTDFEYGESVDSQRVTVSERRADGWILINTSFGFRWINLDPDIITIDRELRLYVTPDRNNFLRGESINDQDVNVLERRPGGWCKINSWRGVRWINLED